MKKFVLVLSMFALYACKHGVMNNQSIVQNESVFNEPDISASKDEYDFPNQSELNGMSNEWTKDYYDSIDNEFSILVSILPQYKDALNKENAEWAKYQDAVKEVACVEYHGSSTPMYVNDVLRQGIKLRELSFSSLAKHNHKEKVSLSKSVFTMDMISKAYASFIKAVGVDEYVENKEHYQDALRNEQDCWNEWMKVRQNIAQSMDNDNRKYYDECSRRMIRAKLFQVKNQNQALGVTGHEPVDCVLPEDCSDKALLEYPGFDVVWERHCNNTDWYPKFE